MIFGLFISDLPKVLRHCKCTLYADDTQIYLHAFPSELDDAISLIESDAQSVADWATRNGLGLNERKTKAKIMGSLQYTAGITPESTRKIKINRTEIDYVSSSKNLGVNVTSTLNWQPHISGLLGRYMVP